MARKECRAPATMEQVLTCLRTQCGFLLLRGIRPIERAVEKRQDEEAEAIRGYCLIVRSALTDDGRPPLAAPGLKLHARISAIVATPTRVSEKGACRVS